MISQCICQFVLHGELSLNIFRLCTQLSCSMSMICCYVLHLCLSVLLGSELSSYSDTRHVCVDMTNCRMSKLHKYSVLLALVYNINPFITYFIQLYV